MSNVPYEEVCTQCGARLTPFEGSPYLTRTCKQCERSIFFIRRGEHGEGIKVEKGESLVLPQGAISLSFDPNSSGMLYSSGIPWLAKQFYFDSLGNEPSQKSVDKFIDSYTSKADLVLEKSAKLEDLDLSRVEDVESAIERVKTDDGSPERWALMVGALALSAREALEAGDSTKVAWAVAAMVNARSMLIFVEQLQPRIQMSYSVDVIRTTVQRWERQLANSDEKFWQRIILESPVILQQLIAAPFMILKDEAYVGGKSIASRQSQIVDYLLQNEISTNVAILEIKTPATRLIGKQYRDIYAPSAELSGAVAKLANYKDVFLKSYTDLRGSSPVEFAAFNPPCILLIGNAADQLTDDTKRKSFELYRRELSGVQILTFDEILAKAKDLLALLEISETKTNSS